MTTPTPPDIAALIARLNPVAQDMSLGPTDALRHYPHAHPQHRAAAFGHDLRTALAALQRLSDDLARERAHAGDPVTWERLRDSHSAMQGVEPWQAMSPNEGHRIYRQSEHEACYMCAALARIAQLEDDVKKLREINAHLDIDLSRADERNDALTDDLAKAREERDVEASWNRLGDTLIKHEERFNEQMLKEMTAWLDEIDAPFENEEQQSLNPWGRVQAIVGPLTAERDALRERVEALKDGLIDMQALISLYNTEPFKHAAKNGDFAGLRNMVAALIGGDPLVWPAPWVQTQWIETLEKHLTIARQALAQDGEKG